MSDLSFLAPAYANLDADWRRALSAVWTQPKWRALDHALQQRHAAGAQFIHSAKPCFTRSTSPRPIR